MDRFRTDTIEKTVLSRVIIGYNIKCFHLSINYLNVMRNCYYCELAFIFPNYEVLTSLTRSREVFGYQSNMSLPDLSGTYFLRVCIYQNLLKSIRNRCTLSSPSL
ncbi:unnamed protein product [Rhizophagus irregularis]|nr:unnamed protein product [Rhizophagus irregularis]